MVSPGNGPGVTAVRPARRMRSVRFLEVLGCERDVAVRLQLLGEGEVRGGGRLGHRTRSAPAYDLVWLEGVAARGSVGHPITERGDVALCLDVEPSRQLDPLTLLWGRVGRDLPVLERRPARVGRLRWPHDLAGLVDPDPAWDVDDTERREDVGFIDERRM